MTEKEYKHEVVRPNEKLPVWVWMHNSNFNYSSYIAPHWHQSIELSYTLTGEIDEFIIEGQNYHCEPGKILVVNSQEIHSIRVKKRQVTENALSIIYTYDFVKRLYPEVEEEYFDINEYEQLTIHQKEQYVRLQVLLEEVATLYFDNSKYKAIKMNVLLLQILERLILFFTKKSSIRRPQEQKALERIHHILEYIQTNYKDELSLEIVANQCHLSREYLARFFKKYMGLTIGQYLAEIRATHAYDKICENKTTLTEIAIDCGFSGIRTMDRALVKLYGKKASCIKKSIIARK